MKKGSTQISVSLFGKVIKTLHLAHVGDQIVMREHDAFGETGRPARIRKATKSSRGLILASVKTPIVFQ